MLQETSVQTSSGAFNVDAAVRERYSAAALAAEAALCCPVDYDPRYLQVIPQEILERDYGCGDPSRYLRRGETVLDLGSGGGKICYIAAQVVGPEGRVIGVDGNEAMLELARSHQPQVAEALGFSNVEFRKGRIQDLQLDLDLLDAQLRGSPIGSVSDWLTMQETAEELRRTQPLVAAESVDVVVSNCVLNLVRLEDRRQLFREIFRVLKRGGRAVISDIVSDEEVPEHLRRDARLWSGCLSGAFQEVGFCRAFEEAGFYGIEILSRQQQPWAVIEGIEFRSVTIQAWKGKVGPCFDHHEAVIYNGPWRSVTDDDGHILNRGERIAVCRKTMEIYSREPYASQITPVPPLVAVSAADARPFDCLGAPVRPPQVTKAGQSPLSLMPDAGCCGTNGSACC